MILLVDSESPDQTVHWAFTAFTLNAPITIAAYDILKYIHVFILSIGTP